MRHHRSGGLAQAIILGGAIRPPVYTKGTGGWLMTNPATTGVQLLSAIEMGTGTYVGGSDSIVNYPNATLKASYKIATECEFIGGAVNDANRDLSKSCVMGEEMDLHPTWIAKNPSGGTNLHSFFGDHSSYFPNLGNTGFQAQAAANCIAFCHRWNLPYLYFDNMVGYAAAVTFEGVVPQGYADDTAWRHNAAIPFINYICNALRTATPPIYTIMSLGDSFDTSLGENVFDEHSGVVRKRFWAEVAAAGAKPDAVFWEYFVQNPVDAEPYSTGEDAFNHRWDSNQAKHADAHTLGYAFHPMNWHNHFVGGAFVGSAHIGQFVRGTFLLDADLTKDIHWVGPDQTDLVYPFTDTDITRDPGGAALDVKHQTGTLWWRQYPNFTAIVNPTLTSDTQTILGNSRTVAARRALYV